MDGDYWEDEGREQARKDIQASLERDKKASEVRIAEYLKQFNESQASSEVKP